jgi:hypothetical protein
MPEEEDMRALKAGVVATVSLLAICAPANAEQQQVSDAEYITQALSAAPEAVAKGAAVVRPESDGSMRTLREGNNGFTCMLMGTDKMCNDPNSMEFIHAVMHHLPPPNKVGISFMLAGDDGASNIDPYATEKTADNHWIVTGPHIMIFGPPSKALGYTEAADPDPTRPYMMWANTPYEHAMIPIGQPGKKLAESRTGMLPANVGQAQEANVKTAMELLESMANRLGPPRIEGTDAVAGKEVPAIYFGSTKMNNNFDLVDEVVKQAQGTATIFVKSGDEYVRVATNVKKDDGSRATGTTLDPKGNAIVSIRKGEAFYGEVDILGKPYVAGYKPIRDSSQNVVGVYYVGYPVETVGRAADRN